MDPATVIALALLFALGAALYSSVGHAGASGTVEWADPESQVICVVLTNRPLSVDDGRFLRLVSNAVAALVEK